MLSDSELNCNNSILSDRLSLQSLGLELYGVDDFLSDLDEEQRMHDNDKERNSIDSQEERDKLIYGDMWRPGLCDPPNIEIEQAVQDPVCFHYEGYLLNLYRNTMASCYIDAPFEMLMQSVFPILHQEGYFLFDKDNLVDRNLYNSFKLYNNANLCDRYEASKSFRSFIWKEFPAFKLSIMADVDELFRFLLQKASMGLCYIFTLNFTRKTVCPEHGDLAVGCDKDNGPVRTISPYDIRTRDLSAASSTQVNATINTVLERSKIVRCPTCDGQAVRKSVAIYHPPFTFFHDGSNAAKHPQNIPFPPHITIHGEPYVLHGKIISTWKEGMHFFCHCSILQPDGKMFLGEIDNLDEAVNVIQEADADIPAKLAKNPDCTVIVCYRRKNISPTPSDRIFEDINNFAGTCDKDNEHPPNLQAPSTTIA